MRERRGEGPGGVCLNAYGRVWVYMGGRVGMCGGIWVDEWVCGFVWV